MGWLPGWLADWLFDCMASVQGGVGRSPVGWLMVVQTVDVDGIHGDEFEFVLLVPWWGGVSQELTGGHSLTARKFGLANTRAGHNHEPTHEDLLCSKSTTNP